MAYETHSLDPQNVFSCLTALSTARSRSERDVAMAHSLMIMGVFHR